MKKNENPINTPDWLRGFSGCEHLTDDEALETIASLKCLAAFLLNSLAGKYGTLIDNQLVIGNNKDDNLNRAA